MPEQKSDRGAPASGSNFTAPFENHTIRYGTKGLNLKDALDALEGWSRHTNLNHDNGGQAFIRGGQLALATTGVKHHSVRKLRSPASGTVTRIWGTDTNIYRGLSGALSFVDAGYSGDPLTLVPHRPPLSGDPWMFVADRARMRKVRADGHNVPIGLPAPLAQPFVALGPQHKTGICAGDGSDGTQASAWTMVAGSDANSNPSGVPTISDDMSPATGAIAIIVNPGATIGNTKAFDSWGAVPISQNLTLVGGQPASDDDVIHLWLKTSHPQNIEEIRVYVVVNANFAPGSLALPGTAAPTGPTNNDAYVKSFRQNDFVQFIQATQTQIDAAETARIFALRDQDLTTRAFNDTRPGATTPVEKSDPIRDQSLEIGSAQHEWFELGRIGVSLRRGDFKRIGSTAGRDWSTATGIILYIASAQGALLVGFGGMWIEGGAGPDTMEVGAQPYDYRCTHYDPVTGAEGNGSPAMTNPIATGQDSLRRQITVSPPGFGPAIPGIVQRIYRRGGSLVDNWYFCGQNSSDGGVFVDTLTDDAIAAAGVIPIDHWEAVPSIDVNGNTITAQPIRFLWGPDQGMLLGGGDPHRPGHLYFCIPDEPDHWSASGNVEVCPPSEELMAGGMFGGQSFVFSRARLYAVYPNLTGIVGQVTATPTLCKRGMAGYWAMCVGPQGIYFVATDGLYVTTGGPEQWLSREIDPIFNGQAAYGYQPIDFTAGTALRLTVWENDLYFSYQDTQGQPQCMVWSILHSFWRHYQFGRAQVNVQGDDEELLITQGLNTGTSYQISPAANALDDGLGIAWKIRTGSISGGLREEKLYGDQFVDLDTQGTTITAQNFTNEETGVNLAQQITGAAGRTRFILDGFGEGPQRSHSLALELNGVTAAAQSPVLFQTGVAVTLQPDITNRRVTNWDDLGSPDEVWLTGVTFDCDTGGANKTVLIERDFGDQKILVTTLTVNCDGRHKVTFSWPAVSARMVRVHPESDACSVWILYRVDWIWQVEPPRISQWDIHFENAWDNYYTGLDLYCDTFGLPKQVQVWVDEVQLTNPQTGLNYWTVQTVGRNVVHLTLPWGRGHVFRFLAVDQNVGLLYSHRWHLQEEPSEQANWNQNFSVFGTRADKFLKAVLFECDTFGQNKTVNIEADGMVVTTLTINTTGRKVVQLAIPQVLGRVWRMFPVDGNPSRLYTAQPIFDEEPFALSRWETQETTHGIPGWFSALYGHIVLKATAPVTLTLTLQVNQPRPGSAPLSQTATYTIPATGGLKASEFVPFQANKGVLIKYVLTSAQPFYLYREETVVIVQPWGAPAPLTLHPFGSDDEDPARPMAHTTTADERSGGTVGG